MQASDRATVVQITYVETNPRNRAGSAQKQGLDLLKQGQSIIPNHPFEPRTRGWDHAFGMFGGWKVPRQPSAVLAGLGLVKQCGVAGAGTALSRLCTNLSFPGSWSQDTLGWM